MFNATGLVRFSERSKIGFFFKKKNSFSKKDSFFLKIAKSSKCDKQRDWNGKNSEHVQNLKLLWKIDGSLGKTTRKL